VEDFDFESEDSNDDEVVQRLEQSLNFWVMKDEVYPPAIRGVMAHREDVRKDVQDMLDTLSSSVDSPDLKLERMLWFDDKNEKLDEACEEAKSVFKPYATNADGLISFKDDSNTLLDQPTRHVLSVSDQFAATNYETSESEDDLILDDDDSGEVLSEVVPPTSWKRKITQTIKPWRVKKDNRIVPARKEDDLSVAMNALLSRTKHGWLKADLVKLKRRRGSILDYAKTYVDQKQNDVKFEFLLQLFGTWGALNRNFSDAISTVACLYVEVNSQGEAYLTKATRYNEASMPDENAKQVVVPVELKVEPRGGASSQLLILPTGKYYDAKIKPLIEQKKCLTSKFDLRKSNSDQKHYRFNLKVAVTSPLLVASSGDGMIFQLQEMMLRFRQTDLAALRAEQADS
jgi:hypothetical protein